jgi:hypothetical protein
MLHLTILLVVALFATFLCSISSLAVSSGLSGILRMQSVAGAGAPLPVPGPTPWQKSTPTTGAREMMYFKNKIPHNEDVYASIRRMIEILSRRISHSGDLPYGQPSGSDGYI